MPVTNYYTVGGEIIAEETSGVRLDYLTDALGSVTATVDQTGTAQNTYRYKPYGALLAKTGTALDPAFTWVGFHGYRGVIDAEILHVRARDYSKASGLWVEEDPLKSLLNNIPYAYSRCNPTSTIDPSGLIGIKVIDNVNGYCGNYALTVMFTGLSPNDNGWIIQHIQKNSSVFACHCHNCTSTPKTPINPNRDYWEAWQVISGQVCAGQCIPNGLRGYRNTLPEPGKDGLKYADDWSNLSEGPSCGSTTTNGTIGFYSNYSLPTPPWIAGDRQGPWGDLPHMLTIPPNLGGLPSQSRTLHASWDCCFEYESNDLQVSE